MQATLTTGAAAAAVSDSWKTCITIRCIIVSANEEDLMEVPVMRNTSCGWMRNSALRAAADHVGQQRRHTPSPSFRCEIQFSKRAHAVNITLLFKRRGLLISCSHWNADLALMESLCVKTRADFWIRGERPKSRKSDQRGKVGTKGSSGVAMRL